MSYANDFIRMKGLTKEYEEYVEEVRPKDRHQRYRETNKAKYEAKRIMATAQEYGDVYALLRKNGYEFSAVSRRAYFIKGMSMRDKLYNIKIRKDGYEARLLTPNREDICDINYINDLFMKDRVSLNETASMPSSAGQAEPQENT